MSGSRPLNGNRQRNLSIASNTSSSSYKDNSSLNQRNSDHAQDQSRASRSARPILLPSGARESLQVLTSNSTVRELQRPTSFFDNGNSLNNPTERERREMQEKMRELQQKKWLYDSAMFQLQHLHSPFSDEPTPNAARAELTSHNESLYASIDSRTRKLQEAQQRLIQLQELMQNVSLDLDYSPYNQQIEDKVNKPKEFPLDFLRNVAPNGQQRNTVLPRAIPSVSRPSNNEQQQQQQLGVAGATFQFSPQNNLSHESFSSPKRYSTSSQVNGSLLDVFARGEPSFESSNEDVEEAANEGDEVNAQDDASSHDQLLHNGETSARHTVRSERLDRIEQQLERTNAVCELVLVEQRRLALVTESLLSAVSNLQTSSRAASAHRNTPSFSLSGLPVNSSWNETGSDFQVLAQAVTQCCHMLTQLQRDLAAVQLSLESNNIDASRPNDVHHNPYRDPKPERSGATACDCAGMDRFDPQVTLNNRVPPGTRTNNYWDNFRSYSRQNLLSSGPSNVTVSDHHHQGGLATDAMSLLQTPNQQVQPTSQSERNPTRSGSLPADLLQPSRRTKRKINKGQRQVEIGVHCPPPHADNRALAYGLLSVRGQGGSNTSVPEGNVRNLNQQQPANEATPAPVATTPTQPHEANSNNANKVVKDNSTLKYSGARPKENRRATEANTPSISNVNLLAEREAAEEKTLGLEAIVRVALTEHATRPQFLSQLLELLHKFDSDPLREMALNALQDCVADNQHRPSSSSRQSELCKLFNSVVGHQRELTPNLLEAFLNAVQLPEELDQEEGATSLSHQSPEDYLYTLRQTLTPFLFRRLSEVHDFVLESLSKLELVVECHQATSNRETALASGISATSISGQEDDLAEADQSCDQSCDGAADISAGHEDSENSQRHSAVGLDEVPTRLMSVLAPPLWSNSGRIQVQPDDAGAAAGRNSQSTSGSRADNVGHWFQEDSSI